MEALRRTSWLALAALLGSVAALGAVPAQATVIEPNVWGYAWANGSATYACYAPSQHWEATSAGTWVTICHTGTGQYTARFVGLGQTFPGVAQASAYNGNDSCETTGAPALSGADELVGIDCFNPAGTATDSRFAVSYAQVETFPAGPGVYAYVSSGITTGSTNSTGGANTVTPNGGGDYSVSLGGIGAAEPSGGDVQITAAGTAGERCTVGPGGWGGGPNLGIDVQCYDQAGNAHASAFSVIFSDEISTLGPDLPQFAYAWSDSAASPSSPPEGLYAFDSVGGTMSETHNGTGLYTVGFPGLGADGNVQVTGYGSTGGGYCNIQNWGLGSINIDCFDKTGAAADQFFSVDFVHTTQVSFFFAEGFTGTGFQTNLSLFMPNHSGTASITYYLEGGAVRNQGVVLTAGKPSLVDVNAFVGANHQVSALVVLPFPGVAERTMHFQAGSWHGSTDEVGVPEPNNEWDFAEGSTLAFFDEYLTLQNPNGSAVTATLNYFTDAGGTPTKTLTLAANSRTTVEVFNGSTANVSGCTPNGNGANCGVGVGTQGVSVKITTDQPIVVERPMYVNGLSYGSGPINDGHDVFGANSANTSWSFAEGTTLAGFNEYLTLQNPNGSAVTATLKYFNDNGTSPSKTLNLPANSRVTVEVWNGDTTSPVSACTPSGTAANCGVGVGIQGVSVRVTATSPIVAERPMYMVQNFGSGTVAGAHVVMGSQSVRTLFGFAAGSTTAGENDYLTIQNPNGSAATVTITYYGPGGAVSPATVVTVPANSRMTVTVAGTAPAGVSPLGILVSSTGPILVEKPTYNSTAAAFGATDTVGYTPIVSFS